MKTRQGYPVLIGLAIAIGAILQLSSLRGVSSMGAAAFMFLWGMAPYFALVAAPRLTRSGAEVIAAVVSAVISDFALRLGLASSRSSTAAIGLIFIPFWVLVVFIPLGLYSVRFVHWLRDRSHG